MPNLLPESIVGFRLDWVHPAGRLIWSLIITGVMLAFVIALIRPPLGRKLVTTSQAVAASIVVVAVGWLAASFLTSIQVLVVWVTLGAVFAIAMAAVVSRDPRPPDRTTTWAEAMVGAVAVFALMTLAYGVIPHEWLTFANAYLNMSNDRFVEWAGDRLVKLPYSALRDVVATLIYVVAIAGNLLLWAKWQTRLTPAPAAAEGEAAATVVRTSRFGRPVKSKA
jgi:hypothetical protein